MANILAEHNFLDEKDYLHGILDSRFVPWDELIKRLHCRVLKNGQRSGAPEDFARIDFDGLHGSGLSVYEARSFFEIVPEAASADMEPPERWREVYSLDPKGSQLVSFPNDNRPQPTLMFYGPAPEINGLPVLRIICFDLQPATEPGYEWDADGPFVCIEQCQPINGSILCANKRCPVGKRCKTYFHQFSGRGPVYVCECVSSLKR